MSVRDKILEEYRAEGFDPKTKIQQFDGGNTYFPCAEKIKFFNADYPGGTIKTEVIIDNNVFATVKATISCVDGTREAFGKWYHSNNDVFGMNYLATAQTIAISKALSLWGYAAEKEGDADPDGSKNIAPEDSAPTIDIPLSPPISISNNGMSVEQAMSTVMYSAPFDGKKIKEILDFKNPKEIIALREQLRMDLDMQTSRADVARVILPLIEKGKQQ